MENFVYMKLKTSRKWDISNFVFDKHGAIKKSGKRQQFAFFKLISQILVGFKCRSKT